MAHRVASLAKGIELEKDLTITGGVAKNGGMVVALEEALGIEIRKMTDDPQIMGALGAALFAREAIEGET
jgi:activator of 2-hydroxyglutaryl-CoA dehydratase